MKNKYKILICGATGFIGRNLVNKYASLKNVDLYLINHKRKKFHNKNITWLTGDLRNKKFVNKITKNIDIIIQAAATTSGAKDITNKPFIHVTDNLIMNSLIFESAFINKVKHVIFFSCTVMYHSSEKALKEIDYNPNKKLNTKYFGVANTKLALEKLCEFYSGISETKYTVIRHSNIYGPYDKFDLEKSHFFGASMSKIMRAKNNIVVWGDGKESRDLLYIDDLVNFVKKVIDKQKNKFQIYNCGYGKGFSVNTIIKKIIKFSNKKISISYDNSKPTIKTNVFLNCNRALNEINWTPKTKIDQGIQKTIKWWKQNIK